MNHTNITNFSSESLSPSSDEAKFPSDFVWGAATSSYQIEGAVTEDGKVHNPNRIDFLARYLGEEQSGQVRFKLPESLNL